MEKYFDYNATAPVLPEVVEAMADALRRIHGNASSLHRHGVAARYEIERVRRRLARAINAEQHESVVFTSGGSEANNLALRGIAFAARRQGRGDHLIVSAAEHRAILDTALDLRDRHGFELTVLPVDECARVRPQVLASALRPETVLVSVILANNEVGSLNPIAPLSAITHEQSNALFHSDAVQALGKIPVDVQALGVDVATFGAHKIGGPKGIGAVYLRDGITLDPQVTGGRQELGVRAGTENVPGVIGFAAALDAALVRMDEEAQRLEAIRESIWDCLERRVPDVQRNSPRNGSLPNTLNVSLPAQGSRDWVKDLDRKGFAISSGSACSSEGGEPSHVLMAMGVGENRARRSVRISLGWGSKADVVEEFGEAVVAVLATLGHTVDEAENAHGKH